MAAAGGSSLSAPGHRTAGRYPRTNRPGAARAVARKSRSRELAHYMVHHDLPNSPSPPPTAVSSGCSGGRTRPGWRWSRPGAGTTITRRLDETHRSGPARSQLHCVRGVVECSGFCERVVGAEAICLSRGDVLRLSLMTGRSSSLLGRPSPWYFSMLIGQERRVLTVQGGESPMPGSGSPVGPHEGGGNVARLSARTPDSVPCPAGRHWRTATARPASPWFRPRL
jgi:hypothetical protein